MSSRKVRRSFKAKLFRAQNGACFFCGVEMILERGPSGYDASRMRKLNPRFCTKDHLYPKRMGGPSDADNYVAACLQCNGNKGGRMPTEREIAKYREIYGEPCNHEPQKHHGDRADNQSVNLGIRD